MGDGSVYQRCEAVLGCPPLVDGPPDPRTGKPTRVRPKHKCRGMWIGAIEAGSTSDGRRRRITVSVKSTGVARTDRAAVNKKLRDKRHAIETHGIPTASARATVKQWATVWLAEKQTKLSPRGYNAAASPVRRWIVPTIGHRRLEQLTPADLRAVERAQRDAGLSGSTAAATHRVLLTMLRAAIVEGHQVPHRVLLVKAPRMSKSDRMDLSVPESVACLAVAANLPHGTRWALALLYGVRQGEALGLTEDMVDLAAHEIRLEWQLDNLPYEHGCAGGPAAPSCGKSRAGSCPDRAFRVPDEYEARHLVDAWHLVRPKSRAGVRVLPMTPAFERAMQTWLEVRPANPWGLVWPTAGGRPANDKDDRAEWHAIQGAASLASYDARTELGPVQVGHPTSGRYYHIHECRNVTATQLGEAGVDPVVIQSLLGHASAAMSGDYRRIHRGPKLAAVELVAAILPYPEGE